ncbi:MAG: N-acetylglucosamine-6-phosphate deacetylase, partial [Deinococcales bacterium]
PGFIDVHVHGGGGADTMDGIDGIQTLSEYHAKHGTTALLATTITNPWKNVLLALKNIQKAMPTSAGARILGAHLEGPFISPYKLGAQPPFALEPKSERVAKILEQNVVRVVTLAPELEGAKAAAAQFLERNVRVSLGHTIGSAEDAERIFAVAKQLNRASQIGGTHLYNAMGGLEGRKPGVLGALLANPNAWGEVILDLQHVHPASFRAAFFAKPEKLLLITDSMRAAGMPDGQYDLGGQLAKLENMAVTLPDGTLAGSILTMHQAVLNAVQCGLALEVALKLASSHPAAYLGLTDCGKIQKNTRADLVVLRADLSLEAVYIGGAMVNRG